MPENTSSESETITRLKKTSRDVIDYLTTLGTLELASLSKEAEERRVKLRQELIEILSLSPDGLVNGDEADGSYVQDAGTEDPGAEDYEVPTTTTLKTKLEEADRISTASIEKKAGSKSSMTQSKSNTDMKIKKKTLTRMKSTQIVELPKKEDRKKEGNLTEKKLMRRTVQHWAVLGPEMLYLAKSSSETHSELKIRLHSASVSAQKNMREFVIKRQGKSYLLRAESDEDCQSWIEQIQLSITEVNEQDCQFSDEEDDVPPVSPAVDATSDDKTSPGPDELYENEDETPKVEDNGADGDDDVYDDVEPPVVATPATLSEPDRTESISSTTSSSSTAKRVSIFGGSGKNKDSMPSEGKLSGFVQKKGKFSWDKKWFVLCDQTLYYSNSEGDKKCQGTLSLVGASIDTKSGNESRPFAINIKYKGNKMLLAWDDSQVYDDWLKAIKSATGDDQSSEPTASEKDLKVDYEADGEEEEPEEPQEDYVNPDVNPPAEEATGDDVYDDVVAEPLKSDTTSKPALVQQKQPPVKKPIQGGGKSELKDPEHSGYLHRKTTGIIKKWERKWFFIVDKTLYMSATEEDESYKNLLALINVAEVVKGSVDKYHYAITLQLKPSCGKDIILAADSKEEQSLWVAKFNEECGVFNCELSSDEEDGAYLNKPPAPEPQAPQVPQVAQVEEEEEEETVRVDDQGFIMEDIYEDVSQPLDAAPQPPAPKEPPKTDVSAPSLPPRNPNLKPTIVMPSVPSLPPRNQPATPTAKSASAEPEPIMDEFYEDMDEVKAQYENAKNVMDQNTDVVEEPPPVIKSEPPAAKKDLSVSKADTEKKSPLLKKKELKKEKEQQKKEAKKKEKESKKLKKEKEKEKERSKSVSKPKSKSAELKTEEKSRSNSLASVSTSKPAEDDEEYVIEELTTQDENAGVEDTEPIDEEIYEDVDEPPIPSPRTTAPSNSIKKPTPPPTAGTTSTKRSDVLSPPGTVSDFKKSSSPVAEPPRSQSVSPSNVKIRTTGITVSSISKPKAPTSVTPVSTTTSSSSTITTKTTSSEKSTSATSITTSSLKTTATKTTSSPLNKPRVRVSEAIFNFQKRSSTVDGILQSGKLFHKAPGRTKFRQEYCEVSGTVLNFYREQGDERAFAKLNLEECELRVVKEQYEGRRYVFCLAAGSASDMLSTELNADLQKWLSVLEPLVKKYVNEE